MFDTIVAISTGNINQPISIIRVSGPDAFLIVKKIFKGKIGKNRKITYGFINNGNQIIDEVLVSWFKSPNTFTGEDIVEINAHGGVVNSQLILKLLINNGARIAIKGEFTRRAFLNKKINLIKAEAIHDLIFAKTEEQLKLSIKKFDGKTSMLINNLTNKLLEIIATIETNIDYPEYDDVEKLSNETIKPKLMEVFSKLNDIKESSKASRYIYNGVKVAIVGKPNAGKSSVLNAMIGENKAIVTKIPGTTRDVVEGSLQIGQILFNFYDTAGIHTSKDEIEIMGIKKSFEQIQKSDLILHIIDAAIGEDKNDKLIEKKSLNKPYIKIFNKSDIKKIGKTSSSAIQNDVESIFHAIKLKYDEIDLNDEKIITNTRQLALIDKSIKDIKQALKGISDGFEPDEIIIDIRKSWKNIASIIGKSSDEEMLDKMFKSFCLGK